MMPARIVLVLMLAALAIAGCSSAEHDDLEQFKRELEQRTPPPPEPLPDFAPYEAFAYGAGDIRSPFVPPEQVRPVAQDESRPQVEPDPNRREEFLEQFGIGDLSMVGTLARDGSLYALIEDPEGGVHRVRPGDYMGGDHGRVEAVDESGIELVEIVSDGAGGWVERSRTVSLGGDES